MSRLGDKAKFKECVSKLITTFNRQIDVQRFVDGELSSPPEHVTRRHFVDLFLEALGWDLTRLDKTMIEEARLRGETTRRLDYLGVDQQSRYPLLIVEAKPWTAPFVASTVKGHTEGKTTNQSMSLICTAIEHLKAGDKSDSPVTQEWMKFLSQLYTYVKDVNDKTGHLVKCVSILSGQWIVIFLDPKAIFLNTGKVDSTQVLIFRDNEFVIHSDEIYNQLARSSVSTVIPQTVSPSSVPVYARETDVKRAFHALWVCRQSTGFSSKPQPRIEFVAALILERRDDVLITVIDQSLDGISIPHDYGKLGTQIDALESQSDELLNRVNVELNANLQLAAVEYFPGFFNSRTSNLNVVSTIPNGNPRIDLGKNLGEPGEFLIVTGTAKHIFLKYPTVKSLLLSRLGRMFESIPSTR